MAFNFPAGQYEQSFHSRRLQNYQVQKGRSRRPATHEGFTQIIANERGHLLPSIPRSARSPWGTFTGTWDLPKRIPGPKITDPMARTPHNVFKNLAFKGEADVVIQGRNKVRRPQCGQPVEAMPECIPSNMPDNITRSGADNPVPQHTGTPQRITPKPMSPPQSQSMGVNTSENMVGQEPIASPVAAVTSMMRTTPIRGASANQIRSPVGSARVSPKQGTPLPDIQTHRQEMTAPQQDNSAQVLTE